MKGLDGVRVVEVAEMLAGPYAAKLLADLGADVIKIEPMGGDPARRLSPSVTTADGSSCAVPFLYVNTSKRSIEVDLGPPLEVGRLVELVATADVLIDDRPPGWWAERGVEYEVLAARNPALVQLSLTPFGQSGPYRDFAAYPLNSFHSCGDGYLTPPSSRLQPDVVSRPPTRLGRFGAEYKLATYAASLVAAAVRNARRTGVGRYIDLSKQEALIGLNHLELNKWFAWGYRANRSSNAVLLGGIAPCQDGFLEFSFYEEHQWRSLVKLMGTPGWTQEPWAVDPKTRLERADEVYERLVEWLSTRRRDDVVAAGQQIGCTVAPYNDVASVTELEQLAHREFFQQVPDSNGNMQRYPTQAYRFNKRLSLSVAPALGSHDLAGVSAEYRKPAARPFARAGEPTGRSPQRAWQLLEGVRVADFSWAVAGPTATMILGALGAQIIKIETTKRIDITRRNAHANATVNRNKLSVTLDLQNPKGAELAREIVAASDVVATSFRPGVMDSLGLGYGQLSELRPELIYLACSMAGLTGPISRYGGYAPLFAAYSGLGHLMGYPDGPPSQVRTGADITAGVDGAFSIVAALLARELHGGGTLIDLSAIESQTSLVGDAVLDHLLSGREQPRRGNQEEHFAPHDCYPCAEPGTWISIVVATDAEWRSFVAGIDAPSWAADSRFGTVSGRVANRDELDKLVGSWTSQRSPYEAMLALQHHGVAAVPSYDSASLFDDPHVIAREVVSTVELDDGTTMPLIRLGGRIGGVPQTTHRPGPDLGEHNRFVLAELLGHADQEIDEWEREGVTA